MTKAPPDLLQVSDVPAQVEGTRGALRAQLRTLIAGHGLFGRFGYLVATQVVTVLIGVAYWAISARWIPAAQVGVAAAAIAAATVVAAIGVLGLNTVLLVMLDSHEPTEQRAVVVTSLVIAMVVVGILAIGVWGISPFLGPSLRTVGRHPIDGCLLVTGSVVMTATNVVDAAALGLRKSRARLARNSIASILKVAFVFGCVLAGLRSTEGLLIGWNASLLLSLGAAPQLLKLRHGAQVSLSRRVEIIQRYWRLSFGHHAVNLAIGSVTYLLPVVAAVLILPKQVAYFSVAQLTAGSALMLPYLLAVSLFVESSGNSDLLRRSIRRTFPVGLLCCAAVIAVMEPSAHLILSVFSRSYAVHGTTALRLLLLGGIPYVAKDHFVAIRRAENRLGEAAGIGLLSTLFEVMAAGIGAHFGGLDGLCTAWAGATMLEGACFLPAVIHAMRSKSAQAVSGSESAQ